MENDNHTIGFTGTRNGMTAQQKITVTSFLETLKQNESIPGIIGLHGDCVGADEDFHNICRILGFVVNQRPCTATSLRAHTDAVAIAEPIAPLERNQKIVDDCDALLACPPTFEELRRSGTWSTIRKGRIKAGIQVIIVYPDGQIAEDTYGVLGEPKCLN